MLQPAGTYAGPRSLINGKCYDLDQKRLRVIYVDQNRIPGGSFALISLAIHRHSFSADGATVTSYLSEALRLTCHVILLSPSAAVAAVGVSDTSLRLCRQR